MSAFRVFLDQRVHRHVRLFKCFCRKHPVGEKLIFRMDMEQNLRQDL